MLKNGRLGHIASTQNIKSMLFVYYRSAWSQWRTEHDLVQHRQHMEVVALQFWAYRIQTQVRDIVNNWIEIFVAWNHCSLVSSSLVKWIFNPLGTFTGIFIAPAYSRVRYRNKNFYLYIRHSVRPSTSVTINFSVPMIARIMKPCIIIVLDLLYKHAPWPCTLDLHFTLLWLCQILSCEVE